MKITIHPFVISIAGLLLLLPAHAQLPASLPLNYNAGARVNFIRTWDANAPEQSPATLVTRPVKDVRQTTAYFDELGRPLQTVTKQGSLITGSSPVDMVSAVVYDAFGRERYQYLPFGANNAGGNGSINDGLFKLNPFQQQAQFYNSQLAGQPGETNIGPNSLNWAYQQTTFESSPLNRVQESFAPGVAWVGTAAQLNDSSRRSIKTNYYVNTAADSIRSWTVTDVAGNWGSYAVTGFYAPGALYKTITVDERGKQVVIFRDKHDHVLLKKVQLTANADNGAGAGYQGWLCTYYLYDNLERQRLVIQPRGVELLAANNWNLTWSSSVILDEQCFRYEYDERGRPIRTKVPGAGEQYTVYDKWDRPVLTQDANLRLQNTWLFTKYDALGRPIYSGKYTNASYTSQAAMQSYLNSLNLARYENYTPAGALPMYTLSQSFPVVTYANILSVTYYDDYTWTNGVAVDYRSFDNSFNTAFSTAYAAWPYPRPVQPDAGTRGSVTGRITKTTDGATALVAVNFYDDKGRVVQSKVQNISGGCDITTTQYSFNGQPLVSVLRQQKNSPNAQTHTITTLMEYDDLWRLLTIKRSVASSINGQPFSVPEQILVSQEYDALDRLKKKVLSPTGSSTGGPLEQMNYEYNVRDWMLGANRAFAKDTNSTTNYFGFDLAYDNSALTVNNVASPYAGSQFNGNIAGMLWKSSGDRRVRRYDFTYDAANRLTNAYFKQFTGSTFNLNAGLDFSTTGLSYDANGNIMTMNQKGWKPGGSITMDSLLYTYYANTNRLQNVWDRLNDPLTRLGDFRSSSIYTAALGSKTTAAVDYTYDANGNLKKDRNKDIGTAAAEDIVYNHLNLVQSVTMRKEGGVVKGVITYTYDAAGNKLRKLVQESGRPDKMTLYIGPAVYDNDTLQFITHEEGRTRYAKKFFLNEDSIFRFQHDYFLRDHLGNVRVVLTEQRDTAQYFASMELARRTKEDRLFYNIPATAYAKTAVPGGYPLDTTTIPNDYVSRVSGSDNRVGPGIVLKVMSGDKVDMVVKSFYRGGTGAGNSSPVTDILASLAAGIVGIAGESKGTLAALSNGASSPLLGALTGFRSANNPDQATKPKAYLNWILLDDQFNLVPAGSSAVPVGAADVLLPLGYTGMPITRNGFLYIYVSNETQNWPVFFDNLSVRHYAGPLTEETHYYPFGLTMAGISSKAANIVPENKYKYNKGSELQNKEFADGAGLEWYATNFRMYDPQIGRWHVLDSKPDHMQSLYTGMGNNPISLNDPLGDTLRDQKGQAITYTRSKDGNITWSKNVTAEWKKVGNALARTKTGFKELQAMSTAKHDVTLKIDQTTTSPGKYGETVKHGKWDDKAKAFSISKAEITIFEGRIQSDANKIQGGGKVAVADEQGMLFEFLAKTGDFQALLGGVATHESVHGTDKKNIKQTTDNWKLGTKHDTETDPEQRETDYYREAVGSMLEKILRYMTIK